MKPTLEQFIEQLVDSGLVPREEISTEATTDVEQLAKRLIKNKN